MEHFGLSKSLRQVDDFETEHHRQLLKDLKVAIHEGGIIALTANRATTSFTLVGHSADFTLSVPQLASSGDAHRRFLAKSRDRRGQGPHSTSCF
jgi:hypothetical protein